LSLIIRFIPNQKIHFR